MRGNCISRWKKIWETLVGFTIDGATVWQFVNFFVVPSIEQRCSNVGKNVKRYNIFSRKSPPTANSGQQTAILLCLRIIQMQKFKSVLWRCVMLSIAWFVVCGCSDSDGSCSSNSGGSWAIYRNAVWIWLRLQNGIFRWRKSQMKMAVAPSISLPGVFELRHLLSHRCTSFDRGWGPARHTELAGSQLRSGTPHWTHGLAVVVRHATLNTQDRGWGPARHTEHAGSRLGSGTPHWTHELVVEVRHATLNSQDRGWGPAHHMDATDRQRDAEGGEGRGGGGEEGGGGEVTHIKSNNPHLTGGEW